jgi:hypothetical protein
MKGNKDDQTVDCSSYTGLIIPGMAPILRVPASVTFLAPVSLVADFRSTANNPLNRDVSLCATLPSGDRV